MDETSTQQKIAIKEIKDNIVVLEGGDLRGILMTTSTNFDLKSTDEQDAIIYKYQQFLNSLDFPIQILMVSRTLDISEYLNTLEQKKREQPNELLRIQTTEYIDFVNNLVKVSNIMNQSFFIVVPLAQVENKEGTILDKLGLFQEKTQQTTVKTFEELKDQLWQRLQYVIAGLNNLGIKAVPLTNDETLELFYRLYNTESRKAPTLFADLTGKDVQKAK